MVSCILRNWDVQLILANNLARPAVLVAGKDRGWGCFYFICFFTFIPPCSSLPSLLLSLLSLFSLSLEDDAKGPIRVEVSLKPNTINKGTH